MALTVAEMRKLEPEWAASFNDEQLDEILRSLRALAGIVSNVYRKTRRSSYGEEKANTCER